METTKLLEIILENQEKRTIELLDLEKYFNKMLEVMENEYKKEKKVHNWDYSNRCKQYLEKVQGLNTELRSLQKNIDSPDIPNKNKYSQIINQLLSFEENNFKNTITLFQNKLNYYLLLKNDSDDDILQNENEIKNLKYKLSVIRENINDIVTSLKYEKNK